MPSPVMRIGSSLLDRNARHFDPRVQKLVDIDWNKVVKPFDLIRDPLTQMRATLSGDYSIPEYTPISDQGQIGSCVANATSDAYEIVQGIEQGAAAVQQLSRRWLYYLARAFTGDQNSDAGTYSLAAQHQLQTIGTFEEQYFPYTDDLEYITGDKSRPELHHYTMASNNRISGFYRLEPSSPTFLDDIEIAVRANHPVMISKQVGQEFQKYQAGQVIGPAINPEGGHCTLIVGVSFDGSTRRNIDRNSWSKYWGNNGHALLSEACCLEIQDAWVATQGLKIVR